MYRPALKKNMPSKYIAIFLLTSMLCGSAGCMNETDLPQEPITLIEESLVPSSALDVISLDPVPPVIVEDDSKPPEEDMVRSRLTNEWVSKEVAQTRPIAVMTPNESAALPHYSLSEASIIYEANVEGRMTRMMAIYEDWSKLEKIGNIRSLRLYFAYWALEWDAFIVHFGGPFFIDDLLSQPTTQNINGNLGGSDELAFFRSDDRQPPHNAYASGAGLVDAIKSKGYPLEYRGLADETHFLFAPKAKPNSLQQYGEAAKSATYIDLSGCYPLTRCYFEYNESDGLYYRAQHLAGSSDGPQIDAINNEQLKFKNIIIQHTSQQEIGEGYLELKCHDSSQDGWYFTNGRGIHINWKKETDYGATRYYDDNGQEITLNTGKTMICIVENGSTATFR